MSPTPRPVRRITFYTKAGCHLCEQAEELLEDLDAEYDVRLVKVDITEDIATFERYKYEIPVIVVEGGGTVGGRVSAEALRRALAGQQG